MLDGLFPIYTTVFLATFILTAIIERVLIPRLKKVAEQPIYKVGPSWHVSKSGTPTMGGLAFFISILFTLTVSALFLLLYENQEAAASIAICLIFAALNSLVGILDDYKKLRKKQNEGLKPSEKLLLQTLTAALFLLLRHVFIADAELISFSFGSYNIGWLYYPMAMIILVGITNCANLTDGIDGLATGVAFAAGVSFFYIACALSYEVSLISSAIMGAGIAFLIFNLHPAKIFMGDTGSLFFGALLCSASFALRNPLIIIFIGGIYVLEGISVILQVLFFKLTKKRLFKMAPLHHHFEKIGWTENRICIVAIISTFITSIPAFVFYLP